MNRPWRMIRLDQRIRRDQDEQLDEIVASLSKLGIGPDVANKSNMLRLALDFGLEIVAQLTGKEVIEELAREHLAKYYAANPNPKA